MRDGPMLSPEGWWKQPEDPMPTEKKQASPEDLDRWLSALHELLQAFHQLSQHLVDMIEDARPPATRSAELVHGWTCPKAIHDGTGFLHEPTDDGPYVVDGIRYCGRCHRVL